MFRFEGGFSGTLAFGGLALPCVFQFIIKVSDGVLEVHDLI